MAEASPGGRFRAAAPALVKQAPRRVSVPNPDTKARLQTDAQRRVDRSRDWPRHIPGSVTPTGERPKMSAGACQVGWYTQRVVEAAKLCKRFETSSLSHAL
jgi:hypothetical protein